MFFLTAAGFIALVFYTYYTRQLVIDAESASTQQAADLKTSFEKTDNAIAATNRLAEEAARNTAESHRLADAAAQNAIESRRLADEAKRSANAALESATETRRLADEITKTATAAGRANALTTDIQRAFMFPATVDFTKVIPPGALGATGKPIAWRANVKWENSGNTPTRDLVITTNCLISWSGPIEEPYKITEADSKDLTKGHLFSKNEVSFVFGPKQSAYAGVCVYDPLSAIFNFMLMNAVNFYIFGDAAYHDLLDPKKIHVTKFCFIILITGNPEADYEDPKGPRTEPLNGTAGFCPKHNCADEECKREDEALSTQASPPAK